MSLRSSPFTSTVVIKYLMALTGLGWIAFIVVHLLGNTLLLSSDHDVFNRYSDTLVGLGPAVIAAEIVILVGLLVHVFSALIVTYDNWRARGGGYAVYESRGKPSKKTISSSTMIWTGLILFVFIVVHVYTFKYGPGIKEGYVVTIGGEQMRDMRRLVVETFSNIWWLVWYVTSLLLLGFHLRHGFWSAFQSLGLYHPRLTPVAYGLGVLVGLTLAVGFIFIPIWVYVTGAPL